MSDYEDFCNDPACRDCGDSMYLDDGCEWPQNPELWVCTGCMTSYAESLKQQLDEVAKQRDEVMNEVTALLSIIESDENELGTMTRLAINGMRSILTAKGGES